MQHSQRKRGRLIYRREQTNTRLTYAPVVHAGACAGYSRHGSGASEIEQAIIVADTPKAALWRRHGAAVPPAEEIVAQPVRRRRFGIELPAEPGGELRQARGVVVADWLRGVVAGAVVAVAQVVAQRNDRVAGLVAGLAAAGEVQRGHAGADEGVVVAADEGVLFGVGVG